MNSLLVFVRSNRLLSAIIGSIFGLFLYLAIITYILPKIVVTEVQNKPKRVDCYINGALYMLFPEECETRSRNEIDSKTITSTPHPTTIVTLGKIQQPGIDNDPVIECRGIRGGRCENQILMLKKSQCYGGSYVCCETVSGWFIQEKTKCNGLQENQGVKYINITLPHNGKQYRCKEGLEDDIYNQSLEIKKLRDHYEADKVKWARYEAENCTSEFNDLNQDCKTYVDAILKNSESIFLGGANKNEEILNVNISKACQ